MVDFFLLNEGGGGVEEEQEKQELETQSLSDSKKSIPVDPLDLDFPELEELSESFSDSFFDFNSWDPELCSEAVMADMGGNQVDVGEATAGELGVCKEGFEELCVKEKSLLDLGQEKGESGGVVKEEIEMGGVGVCEETNAETVLIGDELGGKVGDFGSLIGEQLEKVSLDGTATNGLVAVKSESVSDESDNDAESESESESSASSSSSSSASSSSDSSEEDEEEEDEGGELRGGKGAKSEGAVVEEQTDMEEGEIMLSDADEMVAWSGNEDEDGETGPVGPILSKNELKVLPPVPSVTVNLEPHHQTLPVGNILSILGAQVIVEGVENHTPLNEGSILWITESRSPLGIVDEIFGPVKNPYYVVRYNSESEVPPGLQQGSTLISFVPEFADHILNDKSLYHKGYDASNENDEELSDEVEFSDDEKEAEYKKMLKMKKRSTNEPNKPGKRNEKRQLKNKTGKWNRHQEPAKASSNQENYTGSSGPSPGLAGDQAIVPPLVQMAQAPGFGAPNGMWGNGFPLQQQQGTGLPSGLPPNGMLWMQQQNQQPYQLYQTPLQTGMNFQQQLGNIPRFPLNFNPLGGQSSFGMGPPPFAPWPASLNQNLLNQPQFGMGLPAQPLNGGGAGEQAVQSQGPQNSHSLQPSPGNSGNPFNFNQGRGGGGRRGNHRGRGRLGGGRGRYQKH